jgi:hypothetical protein
VQCIEAAAQVCVLAVDVAAKVSRQIVYFALVAGFFMLAGWPATELCLSLVAVITGLGSTSPEPRSFTMTAVMATPIACVLAGVLKYLVFNGVSEFQLLAIGLAPVVIGLALLISLPSRILSPLGRLTLVFTLATLTPTNPQSYDPEVFLVTCLFVCLSSALVLAAQLLLPPLSGEQRIVLLLEEAKREVDHLDSGRTRHLAPGEATFRDAARIEQIVTAKGASPIADQTVAEAMHCFDRAAILRRCRAEIERLKAGPLAGAARAAETAVALRSGAAILGAAEALRQAAAQSGLSADAALAVLVPASITFGAPQTLTGPSQEKRS